MFLEKMGFLRSAAMQIRNASFKTKSVVPKKYDYKGRTLDFRGVPLWEIVGNLVDSGVGRLVIRNMFQRYPEPCYMRILAVDTVDYSGGVPKVKVTVEKTWRGVTLPKPVVIYSTSYKADYELVPEEEEAKFLQNTKKISVKVIPNKIDLPPLLREFVKQELGVENPMIKVHFKAGDNKFVRLAAENEQPTEEISMALGKPAAENLYEGVL